MMRRAVVVVLVAAFVLLGSAAPAGAAEHVVQPGEWLWSIARAELRSLGATEPTHQQVGARASELYALNRDVIGPDPDLLLPGMRLRLDGGLPGGPPGTGTYADAQGVAVDAENRAVTVGQHSRSFGLVRFLPDGRRDLSVVTPIGDFAAAKDVAVQADGRIVSVGHSNGIPGSVRAEATLVRYLPDGALDPSFGGDGIVTTSVGAYDAALGVAVQPDGRIVVAGSTAGDGSGTDVDVLVLRYLADGSLDPSFGTGGVVRTDVDGSIDIAAGLALLPDGRIVVGGTAYRNGDVADGDLLVARYLPSGALDPAFGGDGVVTADAGSPFDEGTAVHVDGPDVLLVGDTTPGGVDPQVVVLRFDGSGGVGTPLVTRELTEGHAVLVDAQGRLAIGGRFGGEARVVRPDDGAHLGGFGGERSAVFDLALDRTGALVAAGCTCDGANTAIRGGFELQSDPVVRRYPS